MFGCPLSTANSNMEMFKFLNLVDVDAKSSVLTEMDLQFASEHLLAKIHFGFPESFAVYDYFASEVNRD